MKKIMLSWGALLAAALGLLGCVSQSTPGAAAPAGVLGGRPADAAVYVQGLNCPT